MVAGEVGDVIVNWGSGDDFSEIKEGYDKIKIINRPEVVAIGVNKIKTFERLNDGTGTLGCPVFSTSKEFAEALLHVTPICARTSVEGKDGEGLTIVYPGSPVPPAKLYTIFYKAAAEYRVSVCRRPSDKTGDPDKDYTAFAVQKKIRVPGKDHYDDNIKTSSNGYGMHLLSEHEIPKGLRPLARRIMNALGYDFGGLDIIEKEDGSFIFLEINSSPELTPTLIDGYSKHIKALVKFEKDKMNG